MNAYKDRTYYASGGHVDNAYYYYRALRRDGYVLNGSTKQYEQSPTWAASAIDMPEDGTTGAFPVTIPADCAAATVDIVIYKRAGSSPANTDDVVDQYQTKIGSIFGF